MFDVFLDRFEEVEPLAGAPEAGEVYRAFDPERGKTVLLRVLPAGPYEVPAVDHPCVRQVLDTFEEAGRRVLVEEWVEGETLDRWMERADAVPLEERIGWLMCLADALLAAHGAGVVHGAVAPGWIVIPEGGEPKLAGLGAGALVGREDSDSEDDAFAFGLLAYVLLTGRVPFPGVSPEETRGRIDAGESFEGVSELAPDCPPDITTSVDLCLTGSEMRVVGLVGFMRHGRPPILASIPPWSRELDSPPLTGDFSETPSPIYDENVQFTVYRPRSVPSEHWSRLLFFAHLDALPIDAKEGETDPIERVEEKAHRLLGDAVRSYRDSVQDSLAALPREGEVTVVPEIDGVRFNPSSATFLWLESVHWQEFRLRPERRLSGSVARGRIVVRHGAILLAEISLRIAIDRPEAADATDPVPSERETAHAYRSIFPSYSHRDTEIVQQFERYGTAIGDRYLRDVMALRSGEAWSPRLVELIEEADVFQLFWSTHSMGSRYVEQEWRHALGLGRPYFVRPVYWERPMPEDRVRGLPTDELRALHFHFWGPVGFSGPERGGAANEVTLKPDKVPRSLRSKRSRAATTPDISVAPPLTAREDDLYPSRIGEPRLTDRRDPVLHGGPTGALTRHQRDRYQADGFLAFSGFFPHDEVKEMQWEAGRLRTSDELRARESTITEPGSDEIRSVFRPHETSELFDRIARDPRILGKVREMLGGDVYIHQSRINYKPGFRGKEFYWHSDFETWHVEDGMPRMRAVSCSIALTANLPVNGSLMLIPGSHHHYLSCAGETPEKNNEKSLQKQEVGVPDEEGLEKLVEFGDGIEMPTGPAGSVTFFECNTMHGSASNISPYPRINLLIVYNSVENALTEPFSGHAPRPEYLAERPALGDDGRVEGLR